MFPKVMENTTTVLANECTTRYTTHICILILFCISRCANLQGMKQITVVSMKVQLIKAFVTASSWQSQIDAS